MADGSKRPDLSDVPTRQLFRTYREVLRELTSRRIVRTMNAPAGDYAEYLIAALVKGELADNSEKSWDIKTASGERLQVKCRVVQEGKRGQRQLSPFRTWDFDRAVIVLFDDDYGIYRCVALPREVVQEHATYRKHVNGHVMRATDAVMNHPSGDDWTDDLRGVSADM
jgi:hypothetical protein